MYLCILWTVSFVHSFIHSINQINHIIQIVMLCSVELVPFFFFSFFLPSELQNIKLTQKPCLWFPSPLIPLKINNNNNAYIKYSFNIQRGEPISTSLIHLQCSPRPSCSSTNLISLLNLTILFPFIRPLWPNQRVIMNLKIEKWE